MEIRTAHTADLEPETLAVVRALLENVFEGDFSEDDWGHTLGGVHALAWEGADLVGHAAVVQRWLLIGDRPVRAGYVEGVAVRADRRRRGHGRAVMAATEQVVRRAYEVGALSATDEAMELYETLGWQLWRGSSWALTLDGRVRTEDDDGGIFVLPVTGELDLHQPVTCDWRPGEPW